MAAMATVLLLSGACSDDDDAPSTTTAQPPASSATGTAALTGWVEATGPFELQYPTTLTCATVVEQPTYVVPLPTRLGAAALQWQANVVNRHGAGSYDISAFAPISVTVTPDGGAPIAFSADGTTTAALVLNADGSGQLTITGLHDAAGQVLHGSSTWTCGIRG